MKSAALTLTTFFATALAVAYAESNDDYDACPSGLYSSPQCCATNVLGIVSLTCNSPSELPDSPADFSAICTAEGRKIAQCCVLDAAGIAILCQLPPGV